MKKVICFDGVDASGKTTLINALQVKLAQHSIAYDVYNKNNPSANHLLWKTDKRIGIKSTKFAKFAFRFSRLHIAVSTMLASDLDYFLFDRSVLNQIIYCKMDEVAEGIYLPFVNDFFQRLGEVEIYSILLNPPLRIIKDRLSKRKILTETEKKTEFLNSYHSLCNEIFLNSPHLDKRMAIDTDKYSVEESVKQVWEFVKNTKQLSI